MPRRKAGALIPLEIEILLVAFSRDEVHGYDVARRIDPPRPLIGHGTLYKALARLEDMGFLSSRWEDAEIAARASRPRRRLYRITAEGETAITAQERPDARVVTRPVMTCR